MSGAKLLGPPRLGTTPIPRLLCPSSGVQLGEWEKERFSRFWKVSALQQRPSESLPLRAGGVGGFAAGEETGAPRQVTSGPQQYCSALDLGTVLGLHHPQPLGLGDSVPQSWLTGRQAQPLNHVRPEGWSIGPSSSASFCFWVCHLQLWEGPMLLKGRASRGRSPVLCAHLWALWPPSLYCPWPSWGYSPAWRVHTWTAPSLAARIPPWLGASFGLAIWHPGTPSLLLQSG